MSMIIAHNMSAINTQRQFGISARGMSGSMEKLSSGFKINTGKDDPSGLLISEKLRSQLTGILRAKQNTEEAINVLGIAEGALNEMNNIMKKMKSLATHAANNGVTTKDQIEADQAELDSGIQTMDRIAQTTQFSRDNILNGAKEIAFDVTTSVKGTQQNNIVSQRESTFDQIFKRDGYSVSITFIGGQGSIANGTTGYGINAATTHPGSSITGDAASVDFGKQATKAYMEIDTALPDSSAADAGFPKAQVSNGLFTQEQQFTLTGNLGSRQFTFGKNQSVTDMVKDIHATVGATGVDASLIFNSDQVIDVTLTNSDFASYTDGRTKGQVSVFGSVRNENENNTSARMGDIIAGCTGVTDLAGVQWGRNTDGQGNIYIKYITPTEVELYKDASMSAESLVASGKVATDGTGTCAIYQVNNSGLSGTLTIKDPEGVDGLYLPDVKGNYINTGCIEGDNLNTYTVKDATGADVDVPGVVFSGAAAVDTTAADYDATKRSDLAFDANMMAITGIELGTNTDDNGKIYYKTVSDGEFLQVFAYRNENMEAKDLVAESVKYELPVRTVVLDEVRDSNDTNGTGLGIVFTVEEPTTIDPGAKGTVTGSLTFTNLGARIFSVDYGSDAFLKVTQDKGAIFTTFDSPGDSQRSVLDAGDGGQIKLIYGQDATISVNGMEVQTNGLKLNVATQDIQAKLVFNAGKPGSTTIAQVGYDTGSPFTKAGALNYGNNIAQEQYLVTPADDPNGVGVLNPNYGLSAYLCNAGHSTNERIDDFQNGMQLQLGEGAADQNRTVVSLRSMTTENLGRITVGGYWDVNSPSVYSERTFTLKDCLGGGMASLMSDPILTMKVIDRAIDDIAQQRALIGAVQANLLQTNANNLEVTHENVTKTESGIRDADMAAEMSEFTRNQVLQSAGMSMMSQANQRSQQVLQLLQ